jgi:hypothetical protein
MAASLKCIYENVPTLALASYSVKVKMPQAKLPQLARENIGMNDTNARTEQPRNPLHGVTLEAMVRALEAHYGWEELARQIPIRCFSHDPSVNSSLKFLRKTPWAREKVESLYLFMLREQARRERAGP